MNAPNQQMPPVHIKIRSMNGRYSTMGLQLEPAGNMLCPKLKPLDVVAVPYDHPIFNHAASRHIEVTREPTTRPYEFETLDAAMAHAATNDEERQRMADAIAQVGSSLEQSAMIREENKARRDELIASGQLPTEAQDITAAAMAAADAREGLGRVNRDNAFVREDGGDGDDGGVIQTPDAPPPSRSRRGTRTQRGG